LSRPLNLRTSAPSRASGHFLTNAGFFDFSQQRAQLAGMGEHERALALDRLAEHEAFDAGDEPRQLVAPLLERVMTEILASEAEEVKATRQASESAVPGGERSTPGRRRG
jgi:hypothetical protein